MTMTPELKDEWADTLESDRFTQAHGQFKGWVPKGDGSGESQMEHCCLAVLTEIAIEKGCPGVRWDPRDDCTPEVLVEEGSEDDDDIVDEAGQRWSRYVVGDLPRPVALWAGLVDHGRPDTTPTIYGVSAITRNDDERDTFQEIAAAIRRDPHL